MAAGWQNKLARVSRMNWEEVRVRLRQELHKQSDLLMYRMGMGNGSVRLKGESGTRSGQFFLSGIEAAERAELLRKHLPDEAAEILHDADEICGHRFRLLGYENLDFTLTDGKAGFKDNFKAIDWHLDPVHGKRAPLSPWFQIPFLDFSVVGDHKIIWELNRHQHLVTLAKAHLLTGDQKYVHEITAQWHSWIDANPYPLGINWGSTLEVAFRTLSWIWVDQLLARVTAYQEFRARLTPALAFHGRYIERYLSTYFSPNTHLLGEAVALFFLGTLYPEMPRAARWKESGWRIVLHEAGRQVRPDGVYFEQSLHYHVYALDFFLHARLLAARNGMEIPRAYDAALEKMLDVVAALAQAGPAEGFGDDDGGRLFNPRRNRTEHMTDPLALGALMYSREFLAAQLTEEAIWLFGQHAVERLSAGPANTPSRSVAFSDGGLYVLADSQPYSQAMVVDAGPQGVGRSGHGHADSLSLRLTMDGQRWLVDSGTGVYISGDPADRNTFRSTGAHNTLLVDGVDQAVADEPFSWTDIPATQAENWIAGKSFTYFVGSHNGYTRLADSVVHRRHVLKIADGPWLIRDVAIGHAEHELEIRWHFAPDLAVRRVGSGQLDMSRSGHASSDAQLTLIVPEEMPTEVTRTALSPAYGASQPTPLVRCHARVLLPAETATALIPRLGAVRRECDPVAPQEFALTSTPQTAVHAYELDCPDEKHQFLFALADKEWSFGPWSSDARMFYCRIEKEKLVHLVMIGGTTVAWQGEPLLSVAGPAEFHEWRGQDAALNTEDFSLTPQFYELAGGSHSSSTDVNRSSLNCSSSPYAEKH